MIAAQVAHAAGAGSERHPHDVHVVVLAAQDETHLRSISARLSEAKVESTLVIESDRPYDGQAMSVGLELTRDRSAANQVLSSLPLLREPKTHPEVEASTALEVCA